MKKNALLLSIVLPLFMIAVSGCSLKTAPATTPTPVPAANTPTEPKTYSLTDISTHNSETDCWLAIEGKVYNVTEFVGKHPGGKAILKGCGTDATKLFNERPTNNMGPHPTEARQMLSSFEIGTLSE